MSSVEEWDEENFEFTLGKELPFPVLRHCIDSINSTHGLLVGGYRFVTIKCNIYRNMLSAIALEFHKKQLAYSPMGGLY